MKINTHGYSLLILTIIVAILIAVGSAGLTYCYMAGLRGVGPQDEVTIGMWRSDVVDLCGVPDFTHSVETSDGMVVVETYPDGRANGCHGTFTYQHFKLSQIWR
jgi:hypothetical protein